MFVLPTLSDSSLNLFCICLFLIIAAAILRPQLKLRSQTPYENDQYLSETYFRKLMLPAIIIPTAS